MATHGRGLICLCLTGDRCDELGLPPMTERNETPHGTAFTISIEAREGVTTGISAADRAHTIQVAIDPTQGPRGHRQARPCVPAALPRRWSPPARRADRGGRRPRPAGRPERRRGDLRDHERRRDDGPRPGPGRVLSPSRPSDGDGCRPDRVPEAYGEARRTRHHGSPADRVRRLHRRGLSRDPDGEAPRRADPRKGRRPAGRARARPLGVPDRRRLPLAALRLRRAARSWLSRTSRPRSAASCSTWPRKAAGSAC